MKKSIGLPLATISLIGLLAGCSGGGDGADPTESGAAATLLTDTPAATTAVDEISWGYNAQLPTLDPAQSISRSASQVIGNMCDSLLVTQPDFSVADNLATLEYEDDTTMVLTLEEATFWDGSPVEADDAVYSLQRITDPALGSEWAPYFANVESIEARDARTIEITLNAPDALFERALGTMAGAVMQREFSEAAGEDLGSLQGTLMCSGAFVFESSNANQITMLKNEAHWNADRQPFTDRLVINYLVDGATASAALNAGDVQGMYSFPADATESLSNSDSGSIFLGQSSAQFSFVMGNLEGNPLDDPRLRQALSLAMDRAAIAERVFGQAGTAATSFYGTSITPQLGEASEVSVFEPGPDLDAAQALVDEVIEEKGEQRPIVISYTTGVGPEVGQMVLYLQQVANQLGLEVELNDEPPLVWIEGTMEAQTNPSFDVTFTYGGPVIADPVAVLLDLQPGAVSNYSNYQDSIVDDAIATGRSATDETERAEAALAAQAQLAEDLPRIPIANVANLLFMNDDITGAPASSAANGFPWGAVVGGR
jgi:peptide/nickel transport system substrate-binding protein